MISSNCLIFNMRKPVPREVWGLAQRHTARVSTRTQVSWVFVPHSLPSEVQKVSVTPVSKVAVLVTWFSALLGSWATGQLLSSPTGAV